MIAILPTVWGDPIFLPSFLVEIPLRKDSREASVFCIVSYTWLCISECGNRLGDENVNGIGTLTAVASCFSAFEGYHSFDNKSMMCVLQCIYPFVVKVIWCTKKTKVVQELL